MGAAETETQVSTSQELAAMAYEHLRTIAAAFFRNERADHTLQPTAVANEAYLRLAELKNIEWRDQKHFLAFAAKTIRRVLVDHARTRGRIKRRAQRVELQLDDTADQAPCDAVELLDLDDALTELSLLHPSQSYIVELRYFGGLTSAEIAEVLSLSIRTVDGHWKMARTWLSNRLDQDAA